MKKNLFLPLLLGMLFAAGQVFATDTDNDGMTDEYETSQGYNPNVYTKIVYVDDSKTDDSGDGLSLGNGKKTFLAAINISKDANYENVILAAAGTYVGSSNKNLSFGGYDIKIRSIDGAATTIIDLENSGRFIYLHNGETLVSLLDGFTVRNGSANDGGAVYMGSNSGMKIKNCVFENNLGVSYSGAVSVDTGISEITNCRFINNSSAWGGAMTLYKGQGSIVQDCEFINNRSTANDGGAIMLYDCNGTVNISNCKFMYNYTDYNGGAIYARASQPTTLNITNCLFLDNKAYGYGAICTGVNTIALNMKNVTIAQSKFSSDYSCRFSSSTTATIQNSIIQGAILNQGTIVANNNCSQTDLSSYGNNNIASNPELTSDCRLKTGSPCIDSGLSSGAPATDIAGVSRPVGNGVDIGCYEFNDSDADGLDDAWETQHFGNLNQTAAGDSDSDNLTNLEEYNYGTSPILADTDGDSLSDKAEIDSGYNPLLPLRTVYVDNAKADDSGDGLSPANAKKTVSGALAVSENAGYENEIVLAAGTYSGTLNRDLEFGTFNLIIRSASGAANTIINLESSGQFLYLYCPARIEGLTISNGYIENYDGGAIYATDYEVTVKDCVFNSNETSDYGGALSIEYGIANIINCQFTNNCSWAFGAVWLRNNSDVLISNCEFNWNVALLSKGGAVGIDVNYNTTEVYNCKFIENEADTDCGALYMITHEDATLNVTNCLFAENVANNGDIYIDGYTTLNLLNSTIIKSASNVPTCRVNTAAIANMQNNILIGSFVEFGTINADSNCCPNDLSSYGDGNITASPLLDSNYCLTENSPCIDIGIAAGAPDEDLVGVERPQGSGIDFGCYEFKNSFTDSDNDGMDDAWEMEHFGNLDQTANGDYDNDGATNLEEFIHNTNPASYSDVDSDGMSDDWEKVHFGGSSSQTATGDYDSDGVSNLMEYLLGRKPEKAAVNDSATVQLKIFTQLN